MPKHTSVARKTIGTFVVLAAVGGVGWASMRLRAGSGPSVATAEITKGEYVDIVEVRGDVRPIKSLVVTAPMQSGDLQILKIAANGTAVKPGDVVVEFDTSTLLRTIQEKQSELKQAQEELAQARAQASLGTETDTTALTHARFDVDRAKLGLADEDLVSQIEGQKARLTLADAEQRLHEAEVKESANKLAIETGFTAQRAKIAKVTADLDKAKASLNAVLVKAPAEGVVSVMQNYRNSSPMGASPEFRAGDKAWPGAQILELPDLSSVLLTARLDESDRGRLMTGQQAIVRLDAIPDREYQATVTDLSVLARVDFSSWIAVKNFDLKLTFKDADARLRPGMSAAARIAVGRTPDMLLVPAEAVFRVDGRTLVYKQVGRAFEPVPVEVLKHGKEQAAIKGNVQAGNRIALTRPDADSGKASK